MRKRVLITERIDILREKYDNVNQRILDKMVQLHECSYKEAKAMLKKQRFNKEINLL